MAVKTCPKCKEDNSATSLYCVVCGASLSSASDDKGAPADPRLATAQVGVIEGSARKKLIRAVFALAVVLALAVLAFLLKDAASGALLP